MRAIAYNAVARKKVVHITKGNVPSVEVLPISFHIGACQLPRRWRAAADQPMQQSGAASDQQRQYCNAVDTLLHDATDFTVSTGFRSGLFCLRRSGPWGNEVRCRVYLMLYCMP